MARWVRLRDRAGRVLVIANQKRGVLARYGITREEADRAAWTIDLDGHRLGGAAAVSRVMREMGGGWAVVARAYRLRPAAVVEEAVYRWFASNRSSFRRFGVRPECGEAGSGCD
ncbi:MAG TPA: DCC1-like thiol-disulfide oxidoreductase family protein [Candidatus Dormibacteraeota bacterium]|jgi:predicted DCC family thiol-disulfide oxidoreductase YuxK